jgi:mannitol/fructose-specific phosphotransferase system IIA component (Ntr-type)
MTKRYTDFLEETLARLEPKGDEWDEATENAIDYLLAQQEATDQILKHQIEELDKLTDIVKAQDERIKQLESNQTK